MTAQRAHKPESAPVPGPDRIPPDWLEAADVRAVEAALQSRTRYVDEHGPIERVRTHISAVFLTPRHVFKFKRALDVGFADFRALAQRERDCRAEVTLNRRLAADVYLDVLPLRATATGYALDGAGPGSGAVVDWCVVMRRLPAEAMLDRRLAAGTVRTSDIDALAARLAAFHRGAKAGASVARFGSDAVIRENWEENFAQTEAFVGTGPEGVLDPATFEGIREGVADWLARNAGLVAQRMRGGFIRDGHGDLRCEHIWLSDAVAPRPPDVRIIDCIEFNERFRFGDVANDLAFLLMDLVALGHPALAERLLERYATLSGDDALHRLVPFYACYRAYVRGKVTAFKLRDRNLAPSERERIRRRAAGYFELASDFRAQLAPPVLVLVAGLMGTGKTSLAAALGARAGLAVHSSDAVRKALADAERAADPASTGEAPWGGGIYSPAWSARTYDVLHERARAALLAGASVVLDASFASAAERDRMRRLADDLGARAELIECRLDEAATRERLRQRSAQGGSLSDGREALYAQQSAAFEPVTDWPRGAYRVVTTDRPAAALAEVLLPTLALPSPRFGLAV